ncbi:unnamed protein product [Soboliphyme baturini]|uniref:A_deaminase domain-containing protein n=1 Tax=Soboliphyme baturini TaxID=241478 RepID=A0A183IB93_9BILA|nr:unnamed protein product [Soboliphyme baturini]
MSTNAASHVLDLAKRYRNCDGDYIVGIDLSGNPEVDATHLLPVLRQAKYDRFKLSLHVSEVAENGIQTLKLLELQPERIGHATCLLKHSDVEPFKLMTSVIDSSIPIEICLSSNVVCRTVESYEAHHMEFWRKKNHPIVLCTDDKGIFLTCLSREFTIAQNTFQLSNKQLCELSFNALQYSFASEYLKNDLNSKWKNFWSKNPD